MKSFGAEKPRCQNGDPLAEEDIAERWRKSRGGGIRRWAFEALPSWPHVALRFDSSPV